ncbi:hypothetical protein B0H17DRAFT_1198900 [Mycena rosella]|uniref:Uncharacterized protein n=1 Tax=Mycena rosella TaxID=1033263 RepID=A0AAD7DNA1_MYCRO|nr:hypothetical protein B0H17DRAFT_1198900 [Mycena rosella]
MSANPAHYNTADRVRFKNYADNLCDAAVGMGPNPGLTPPGYREYFHVLHRYAPVLEDFPNLGRKDHQHTEIPCTPVAHVSMSAAALGTILDSQHKLMYSVLAANKVNQQGQGFNRLKPDYRLTFYKPGYRFNRGSYGNGRRGGYGGRNLVDRIDGPSYVGGGRKHPRRNRPFKDDNDLDIASDVATAGGLTDDKDDGIIVDSQETTEEIEEGEDNRFDADLNMN